ncbi:hypothetical protein [Trueperella sp. LYQ143]|uniref:hypothetical protein n=1 Tax=unclassified Trueperella TaxID=2630174 RepID=UPI003983BE7F
MRSREKSVGYSGKTGYGKQGGKAEVATRSKTESKAGGNGNQHPLKKYPQF